MNSSGISLSLPLSLINDVTSIELNDLPSESRGRVCSKVHSEDINNLYRVYQWLDDKGSTQISDAFPKGKYTQLKITDLEIEDFFKLGIDSSEANLPAFTEDQIRAGVSKAYRTFRDVIKIAEIRKIQLNIKFISDKELFHHYRERVAPDTNFKATGFYSPRFNQSTIWAVGDKDHITRISLHESTHAMVAAMFGDIPIWLNEGLAGFFEKMLITGEQNFKFSTNDEHLKLLKSSVLPSLINHFSQSHSQWNQAHKSDLNYAIDWSLIFYLMTRDNGRNLLRYMLDQYSVNYCQEIDSIELIERHYQGGVSGLNTDWLSWLKDMNSDLVVF